MMRSISVAILALMIAGIGWLTFDWYAQRHSGEAFGAPFALVDQFDKPITQSAFRGHPSALFFGYTHCPEVCPTTLFELDAWLKKLGPQAKDVKAYFITIDPERDTPQVMNQYVSNVSKRITGISGDPAKVEAMAKSFGIYFRKIPGDTADDYTMDHTASVLLLDRNGAFVGTIAYGEDEKAAMAKLKRLEDGA
ncbi:MAG: SCO family protein [Rhizobiaceae bacterium]|nr:MAG: SCO family protein [Rhizobiaceae bacterium]